MIAMPKLSDLSFEVLPKKEKLVVVNSTDSVHVGYQKLFSNGILSAPVINSDGEYVAILDVVDFVIFNLAIWRLGQDVFSFFGKPSNEKLIDMNEIPPLASIDEKDSHLKKLNFDVIQCIVDYRAKTNPTLPLNANLDQVACILSNYHSLAIVDDSKKVVGYVTQSDLVKYLFAGKFFSEITLHDIGIEHTQIVHMNKSEKVLLAFKTMALKQLRAVAIYNDDNKLVGDVSAKDIRIACDSSYSLDLLIDNYENFSNSLQKKGIHNGFLIIPSTTSIHDFVDKVLTGKHHHAYVSSTQTGDSVVGVVTFGDLLRFFLKNLQK